MCGGFFLPSVLEKPKDLTKRMCGVVRGHFFTTWRRWQLLEVVRCRTILWGSFMCVGFVQATGRVGIYAWKMLVSVSKNL